MAEPLSIAHYDGPDTLKNLIGLIITSIHKVGQKAAIIRADFQLLFANASDGCPRPTRVHRKNKPIHGKDGDVVG
jgi:hypothetical protein